MTEEKKRLARYEPGTVELAAQKKWADADAFRLSDDDIRSGDLYYCLEMFPYPSGKLHMGHVRNYSIGDSIARFQRMNGKKVLYPMGFDSFGLPAENAAIQGKAHPADWTFSRIDEMVAQLTRMGFSYDWDRKVVTCVPEYYRWNQWFFLKFMEKGLVYRKEAPVNWCPKCATVLANEQVHEGRCWRHEETVVEEKQLAQWFFKTTAYAERLLKNIDSLTGWPPHVREMQRNWIGRSEGVILRFPVENSSEVVETFTTRPDTVYGITYLVMAPEHPLAEKLVTPERREGLREFRRMTVAQSRIDRMDAKKEKHGYSLGVNFVNPFTGETHPLFVADYALMDYGTGAVMAVPAHDQRDFEFAKRNGLPIRPVIHPEKELRAEAMTEAYEDAGVMRNSGPFDGMTSDEAWQGIATMAEEKGWGRRTVNYRLRDWLLSRQRYWGTPIPAVYCETCGVQPVPEKYLPVVLPTDISFTTGGNPLATSEKFLRASCPKCGGAARRETDTMDTFVDSSWYFLRYCDPKNASAPFSPELAARFMPVDQYIGGVEHACMHLIYARFFTMVMKDLGLAACEEPFTNLLTQGMVCHETYQCEGEWVFPYEVEDGVHTASGKPVAVGRVEKMSKSKKNTVDPGEIIDRYGADTARAFMLFASPPEMELLWSEQGVEGAYRFLRRVFDLVESRAEMKLEPACDGDRDLRRKTHLTIQKVTKDIAERFQFNTAIAALMELLNAIQSHGKRTAASDEAVVTLVKCLSPIAPHLAEDRWEKLGNRSILSLETWPIADPAALVADTVEVPVQVNGKLKGRVTVAVDADESAAVKAAREMLGLAGDVKKVVYRPGKILNLVM